MKKINIVCAVALLAVGFVAGRCQLPAVHAQIASPSYGCPSSGSGGPPASNCAQYLVQISSAREGGGAWVYLLPSTPVDVSAVDSNGNPLFELTQSGFGAMQYFKPSPSTATFTLGPTVP